VPGPGPLATSSSPGHSVENVGGDHTASAQQEDGSEKWQIEHVLFPAMKRYLAAPKSLLTRDVVQIASLPDLYRVFERC
jgi:DNA mismatch repair protein MLH1